MNKTGSDNRIKLAQFAQAEIIGRKIFQPQTKIAFCHGQQIVQDGGPGTFVDVVKSGSKLGHCALSLNEAADYPCGPVGGKLKPDEKIN
ncbi:hypothetical protein GCM10011273_08830 [Asticcacaulis endophyticus]|uniref:Uncharacterized protein n=1 Tax=Asticcacaulis endophyticus TaxID=1395890 RepID=A0A918PYM7_9CAUL|nr:hypothetical protein GCM10011273_08830 [Asticcacaulis endophyticus]